MSGCDIEILQRALGGARVNRALVAWLRFWKHRAMRAFALLLTAIVIAACGDDVGTDAGKAAAPESAMTPLPTIDMADLKSGVQYTTRAFEPRIRFTIPEGEWKAESADKPDHIEVVMNPDPPVQTAGIGFHHMKQVFPPGEGGVIPGDAVEGPDDFAEWLTSHPHLKASKPRPVEALGLEGVSVDVTVKSSQPKKYKDCGKVDGPHCVVMYVGGIEPLVYGSQTFGRFLVLEQPDGGELVVEQFVEPRKAFGKVAGILDEVLASASLAE